MHIMNNLCLLKDLFIKVHINLTAQLSTMCVLSLPYFYNYSVWLLQILNFHTLRQLRVLSTHRFYLAYAKQARSDAIVNVIQKSHNIYE